MSILTDFFTSLANKIRSKTGNSNTLTPSEMISEIDNIYTPTQTKSITASTSAITVTPDTGYHLSSVTVNPTPSQEKTVTGSRSAQTVTPDSGKLLSKVTVNKYPDASGTFNASTTRSTAIDMGATNNYRYVNTNSVSNTNSGTYTPTSNSSAHDMGATNTYRYVNTNTVYNSGYSDGANYRIANLQYTPWSINSIRSLSTESISLPYNSTYLCVFYKSYISGYSGLTNYKSDVVMGDIRISMFYGTTSSSIGVYGYDRDSDGSYMIAVVQPYSN